MSEAETKLEKIARHVLSARQIVARQRALIADRKAAGHNTGLAEGLLSEFEHTLAIFEQELADALPKSN